MDMSKTCLFRVKGEIQLFVFVFCLQEKTQSQSTPALSVMFEQLNLNLVKAKQWRR